MTSLRRSFIAAAVCTAVFGAATAQTAAPPAAEPYAPKVGQPGKDVIWVPTSQVLVDRMLDMAQLSPKDRLVDLGSGDGRMVITAAKRGVVARGIEYNPDMVALSRRAAEAEGVTRRATFERADIFQTDFSNATVVTLFLLPELNLQLRPTLLDMKPGTRVVSNSFDMGDWQADETAEVKDGCTSHCNAYKWVVPAKVAGTWMLDGKRLELTQTYQMLEGALHNGDATQPVGSARMDGDRIRFSVGDQVYTGQVKGKAMRGTINGAQSWKATRSAN